MTENQTRRFINVYDKDGNHIPVLSKLMETYNNRKHRMTGFSPNEADKDDESTHLAIRLRQSKEQEKIKPRPIKFKVGDKVRISKIKGKFGRGYQPSTQLEIFRIYQIKNKSKIPMYVLESNDGNEILEGAFYDFELTKVTEDLFRIEKILKTETKKGKTRHYVKWKGFNDSYNSWIDGDNIVKKF
jgi:transcription antitermination factor NusG